MKKDVADVQKSHKDFIQQSGENLADNMARGAQSKVSNGT